MANGHGGKRSNSGRKPLSYEKDIRKEIDQALGEEGMKPIWDSIIKEAKNGSSPHQNTLLAYYHGKPKETNNINGELAIIIRHE